MTYLFVVEDGPLLHRATVRGADNVPDGFDLDVLLAVTTGELGNPGSCLGGQREREKESTPLKNNETERGGVLPGKKC